MTDVLGLLALAIAAAVIGGLVGRELGIRKGWADASELYREPEDDPAQEAGA